LRIARTLAAPLLGACLLAACGNDNAKSRASASTAASDAESAAALAAAPTALILTGQPAFQGPVPVHCALSEPNGLQINFRTGDPDTPAVAVRVDEYRGNGPYAARVFVTGRSTTGSLVTSTGEAHLVLQHTDPPAAVGVVMLSGKLDGTYQGDAGAGSITGRFASCGYSQDRAVLLREAAGAVLAPAQTSGDANQVAGDAEEAETLAKAAEPALAAGKADTETLPAPPPPRAVKAPRATKSAPAAARPHRRARRVRRRHR
jgi:hypothetical protein